RAAVPARSASARAGGRPRWRPAPFLQFGRAWRASGGCFCQSWRIASFVHTVCPGGPDYIRTGGVLMETKGWKSFWTALWVSLLVLLPLVARSEEHTSELQSRFDLVCRLLLEKKKHDIQTITQIADQQ